MKRMLKKKYFALAATVGLAVSLSACAARQDTPPATSGKAIQKTAVWVKKNPSVTVSTAERECLARAIYFESNRNSTDGMLAVGSVVMNRLETGRYGNSICGVVGAPRQFAAGVLSRPMTDRSAPVVRAVADEVLAGHRHAKVGNAKYFHMAGLKFSYPNMHYVVVAGGNAFYDRRDRRDVAQPNVQLAALQQTTQQPALSQTASVAGSTSYDAGYRQGSVILNLDAQREFKAQSVQIAATQPADGVTQINNNVSEAINQAIVKPLPPRRPKLLGLTSQPDKQASADTLFRVAQTEIVPANLR